MIRMSIRRPVAVAMTYFAVALLGLAAWRNIPIEMLPDTQLPQLYVEGSWPGSSPETVEAFLTSPLEATIQQLRGVEKIISESTEGATEITVEFNRETDMDFARLDLSERISQLEDELPQGVAPITVRPYVPREFENQLGGSVLTYTMTGPYVLEALRAHVDDVIKPALEQLDGVGEVVVRGGRKRLLRIELDEAQVLALGLTPGQVRSSISSLDLVREAGAIRDGDSELTLTIQNRARDVGDIYDAVVASRGESVIRVRDVAHVSDTYEEARGYNRINSSPAVSFDVRKETRANTVAVANAVKARMVRLENLNPFGTRIIEVRDQSVDIRRQLTDLRTRALVAAAVIFVVLLLFLRSFRSAAMIFATIAFSVLISLNLIYFRGMTLNLLTLMGLAMGFGLVVDNSIVVLENIYRRWQGGEEARSASETGAREVVLPILAATATTMIVFVPFVYLKGELRVFYMPLAVVVGLTLLASLFVAFTFIPALAARWLTAPGRGSVQGPADPEGTSEAGVRAAPGGDGRRGARPGAGGRKPPLYVQFYSELIRLTLRFPWAAVVFAGLCFAGSYHLFDKYVTRGVIWGGGGRGQETYVSVNISLPRGSDLERADALTRFFEDKLKDMPEVEQYQTAVAGTRGSIYITFPDSLELTEIPVVIKEQMVAYSLGFTGAAVRVYGVGPSFGYGGGGSAPNYAISVLGYNYERVRDIAESLGRRLVRISRIQEVDTNASSRRFSRDKASEFVVEVDRDALARYDMSVQELSQRMSAAVRGARPIQSTLRMGGDELDFEIKLSGANVIDVHELRETMITGPAGTSIRLGDVVRIYERDVLARIRRENQQYERTVAYEFRGPSKLGDVIRDRVLESTQVPEGYTVQASEGWRFSVEERNQIFLVLSISILLIYMVTAALFESLGQPLAVLLTVPMALIGVFLMFFFTEATFTREAYIGVIMMGGIVVNSAILLVDHVNKVRARGDLTLEEAILVGSLERVRPILMTATTTVLGLLPLVLMSDHADSNIWNALGYALVGGLLSSTFFVLTTTPALYLLFERAGMRRTAEHEAPILTPVVADA